VIAKLSLSVRRQSGANHARQYRFRESGVALEGDPFGGFALVEGSGTQAGCLPAVLCRQSEIDGADKLQKARARQGLEL
jgi:hypothetical protein